MNHRLSPLTMSLIKRFRISLAVLMVVGFTITSASAADVTKADNTDNLNLGISWGGTAPTASDVGVWENTVTGANTVSLGANLSWQGLRLDDPGGDVTIGGGNTLTLGSAGLNIGSNNLTYNSTGTLDLNGSLSGSGTLTLDRNGTDNWTGMASTDFTGTLVLRGGSGVAGSFSNEWLAFGADDKSYPAVWTQTGSFHLDTGASLTDRRDFIMTGDTGGHTLNLASLTGYGDFRSDWGNNGTAAATGNRTISVNQSIDTEYQGRMVQNNSTGRSINLEKLGTGNLTLSGNNIIKNVYANGGTLTLSGDNTFTNQVEINGGDVVLGHGQGLGANGSHSKGFVLRDGTLDINGQRTFTSGTAFTSLLFIETITLGGQAGGVMEITDSVPHATTPSGIAIANNLAFEYDATGNPGTATISADWVAVNTQNATTKEVRVGDSANADVEIDFTGLLREQTASTNGRRTTIRKTGEGTMQISAANRFPHLTVDAGELRVNHADALGASSTAFNNRVTINNGGTLNLNGFENTITELVGTVGGIVTNNHASATDTSTLTVGVNPVVATDATFNGSIQDGVSPVALTKGGTNTQTLTGANTYTGATTVSDGTLQVNGSLGATDVSVANGAILGSGAGATIAGTLSLADGAGFRTVPSSPLSVASGVTLAGTNTVYLDGAIGAGAVPILDYGSGLTGGTGGLVLNNAAAYRSTTFGDNGNEVTLDIGAVGSTWKGTGANPTYWDNNVTANWAGGDTVFRPSDSPTFDDTASEFNVQLQAPLVANAVVFSNSANAYTITGVTAADVFTANSLAKSGTNSVSLAGDHVIEGDVTVTGGKLLLGDGGTTGPSIGGDMILSGTAEIVFDRSTTNFYVPNDITGSGVITKAGTGRMHVQGDNSAATLTWNFDGTDPNKDIGFATTDADGAAGSKITVQDNSSGGFFYAGSNVTLTTDLDMEIGAGGQLDFNGGTGSTYTATGLISGDGLLYKASGSTVILTADNTYTGGTFINNGFLQIGDGGSTGSLGAGNVEFGSSNDTLRFNRSNAYTVSADISGAGHVVQEGTGTTTLAGNNTYSGATTVSAGTLFVNGSLGSSAVSVGTAGTLGGIGTIGGATTVSGGLNPGNSPGILTFNDALTLESTATTTIEIASLSSFDVLANDGGDVLTASGTLALELFGYTPNEGDSFVVLDNWGGFAGSFDTITGTDLGGGLSFDTSTLLVDGIITVVPEPSVFALLGLGLLGLTARRRS